MPELGTEAGAPAGADPEPRRAELLQLRDELEQSRRYTYTGHIGALTDAVLEIQDQGRETSRRLAHFGSELGEVKADLGCVKVELGEVKADLGCVKVELGEVKADLRTVKVELGEVKADLGCVKADLGSVKTDLRRVDRQLGLVMDEVRTTGARVERLVGYIIRDERGEQRAGARAAG
jgi:chromosome segregation ATPase